MKDNTINKSTLIIISTAFALLLCAAAPATAAETKGKSGSALYADNCGRCHSERYPTERTDKHWKTIMMHMRVRAQLTGTDANKILEYLTSSN